MADDGLDISLNFAQPSQAVAPRRQTVPKGGRWTDRARAKKEWRDSVAQHAGPSTYAQQHNGRPASNGVTRESGSGGVAPPGLAVRPKSLGFPSNRTASSARPSPVKAAAPERRKEIQPDAAGTGSLGYEEVPSSAGPSRVARPRPSTGASGGIQQPAKATVSGPQIISSLFSYNPSIPKAPTIEVPKQPERVNGVASNAPLGDTSTFSGLGLHELLVRHLKGKMSVEKPTGVQRSSLPYLLSSPLNIDTAAAGGDEDDQADAADVNHKGGDDTARPRDVFIQSQTGSGKTLAYLLPIIQTLLPLSRLSYIDRSIGTLAIILAPTRELAQQISKVLEQLLSLSLAQADDAGDQAPMTRWLVSGLLTGGSTKTHEKAKLRKGVPILVATPGRLLDHLQNSTAFRFAKTMFLVLDEADRLMDLGFEETIKGIIRALDGRRRAEMGGEQDAEVGTMKWNYWSRGRQNILCSATVDAKVQKLAGVALEDPIVFRADPEVALQGGAAGQGAAIAAKSDPRVAEAMESANAIVMPTPTDEKFTPPSQLSQRYIIVPTKLRLVTLVALLRSLVARKTETSAAGNKVIVFMSSTDAVDYHWKLIGGISMGNETAPAAAPASVTDESHESADDDDDDSSGAEDEQAKEGPAKQRSKPQGAGDPISLASALFPGTTIHRLHGSLPLRTRLASLAAFAKPSPSPSILICTSVASRGLDLPLVRSVIQYDLPTEGGANEYVHRVGRTARAGKGGEAWAFVGPSEVDWVEWVKGKMGTAEGKEVRLAAVGVEDVLKKGFGGKGWEFERRATEVQGALERWVLSDDKNAALARKAFASFVRAYSTHPLEEKRFFHPKSLHLGHLAKSFALRDAPSTMANASSKAGANAKAKGDAGDKKRKRAQAADDEDDEDDRGKKGGKEATARNETERRMYEAVRKQGREVRSGGKLGQFGAGAKRGGGSGGGGGGGEFQVMGTGDLERMLAGKT